MVSSQSHSLAALALSRFGLGARPGDIELIAADPKGALATEIAQRVGPAERLSGRCRRRKA
jgi:uncharacterized protein (DUF1800 family)